MRHVVVLALALVFGGSSAWAANPAQAARLKACAEEWRKKQQAGAPPGGWRAFSKECLARTAPEPSGAPQR